MIRHPDGTLGTAGYFSEVFHGLQEIMNFTYSYGEKKLIITPQDFDRQAPAVTPWELACLMYSSNSRRNSPGVTPGESRLPYVVKTRKNLWDMARSFTRN